MGTKEFEPLDEVYVKEWMGRSVTLRPEPTSRQHVRGMLKGIIFETRTAKGVILTLIVGDRLVQVFSWMAEIRLEQCSTKTKPPMGKEEATTDTQY